MSEPNERLQKARREAGYETAADAARAFGWNEITYRAHENNGRGLGRQVERYARAFGVTPEWLLYGRGEPLTGIDREKVQILAEVLLGISCTSRSGLEAFAEVLAASLQGPIEPPTGVPPLIHLRSSLHNKVLEFLRQANERTAPQSRS